MDDYLNRQDYKHAWRLQHAQGNLQPGKVFVKKHFITLPPQIREKDEFKFFSQLQRSKGAILIKPNFR